MRLSAHPERKSAFEQKAASLNLIHGKCRPGRPWQNGIIERSHRTDNEELFHQMHFTDSEMRRYQLKLWEFEYNNRRPHQSLGGRIPIQIYLAEYRLHAASRMLM
jgi:transposase InsO family protein